jgi:quinol monooxygenase YgiN
MTFEERNVKEFLEIFEESKQSIKGFEGCLHLELLQDYHLPNVFLTYSHWENDGALDNYRHSDLFEKVWAKTKPLFSDKPVAFSSQRLQTID